jgi:polysaccharide export outer membrane protein
MEPPPPAPDAPKPPPQPSGIQKVGFIHKPEVSPYTDELPRELSMVTMPEYVIEPPDILRIDALRIIPPSPYKLQPLDGLFIQVLNVPMEEPINGLFVIDPDGTITLGPTYGPPIKVIGMTPEQVKIAVEEHLKKLKVLTPKASVSLGQSRALQQIRGEHLVRQDGTVGLGAYGGVRVVGLTLTQAKIAIEQHLSHFVQQPEIAVDVAAYNSKVYYVIYDGAGNGQMILQMPITGNDTVLKAIAQLNGMPPLSSKYRLWIARPAPMEIGRELIMPIDWTSITTKGQTRTNYQLMPGDRLYVSGNRLIAFNTYLSQALAPLERMLGVTLLGNTTIRAVGGQNQALTTGP